VIRLARQSIEVVATDGDHELGGADWDERLATHLAQEFVAQCPEAGDPLDDSYGAQDLITTAEETKQSLSVRDSVDTMVVMVAAARRSQSRESTSNDSRSARAHDRRDREVLEAAKAKGVEGRPGTLVGGMSKSPAVARRMAVRSTPNSPTRLVCRHGRGDVRAEASRGLRPALVDTGKIDAAGTCPSRRAATSTRRFAAPQRTA
jgi:molecular chaperone DnaK (HSP70)